MTEMTTAAATDARTSPGAKGVGPPARFADRRVMSAPARKAVADASKTSGSFQAAACPTRPSKGAEEETKLDVAEAERPVEEMQREQEATPSRAGGQHGGRCGRAADDGCGGDHRGRAGEVSVRDAMRFRVDARNVRQHDHGDRRSTRCDARRRRHHDSGWHDRECCEPVVRTPRRNGETVRHWRDRLWNVCRLAPRAAPRSRGAGCRRARLRRRDRRQRQRAPGRLGGRLGCSPQRVPLA